MKVNVVIELIGYDATLEKAKRLIENCLSAVGPALNIESISEVLELVPPPETSEEYAKGSDKTVDAAKSYEPVDGSAQLPEGMQEEGPVAEEVVTDSGAVKTPEE